MSQSTFTPSMRRHADKKILQYFLTATLQPSCTHQTPMMNEVAPVANGKTDEKNGKTMGGSVKILLSIVDISIEVLDDCNGTNIPVLVTDVLDSVSCTTAENFLSGSSRDGNVRAPFLKRALGIARRKENSEAVETAEKIRKQVTRFLRIPDKYISFTSVLLKSQAFHMTYPSNCIGDMTDNDSKEAAEMKNISSASPLPVTIIPRTPYKKPYIPRRPLSSTTSSQKGHKEQEEVNLYPLSISHQFPFVGMARLVLAEPNHHPHQCRPLVGLDIVTFDDYNPKLYNSLADFVHVFHESFTPWEWTCIQHAFGEGKMLQEFYLRWAIKESYTKALGVGMGLPFDSFETRLEFATNGKKEAKEDQGIFEWMCQEEFRTNHSQSTNDSKDDPYTMLPGSVVVNPGTPKATSESCSFYFKPLWELDVYGSKRSWENVRGCACICIIISQQPSSTTNGDSAALDLINGPDLHGSCSDKHQKSVCVTTDWQSLEDLISWHRR